MIKEVKIDREFEVVLDVSPGDVVEVGLSDEVLSVAVWTEGKANCYHRVGRLYK